MSVDQTRTSALLALLRHAHKELPTILDDAGPGQISEVRDLCLGLAARIDMQTPGVPDTPAELLEETHR